MLHDQHIRIDQGRAVGGDFMRITHVPTGISRLEKPPLGTGKEAHDKKQRMLNEIEEELKSRGMIEYIWNPQKKHIKR